MSAVAADLPSALAALPSVATLAAPWRQALAEAAGAGRGEAAQGMPAPIDPAVLARLQDTLDALASLNADGEAVLATILHDLPD